MASLLPCLNVYEKKELNCEQLEKSVKEASDTFEMPLLVAVDTPYIHLLGEFFVMVI